MRLIFVVNCYLLYLLRDFLGVFSTHHRKAVRLHLTILIMSRKRKSKRRSVTQICLSDSLLFQMRSLIREVAINKENSTLLYHKFIIAMFFCLGTMVSMVWGNIPQMLQVFLLNCLIMCFHINDNLKTIEIYFESKNHSTFSYAKSLKPDVL